MLVPLLLNNVLAAGHAVLAADSGTYAETGAAAGLIKGSRISAGNGSYAVTGNANLTYTPVIAQGSVAGLRKTSTLSLSYPYTTELT